MKLFIVCLHWKTFSCQAIWANCIGLQDLCNWSSKSEVDYNKSEVINSKPSLCCKPAGTSWFSRNTISTCYPLDHLLRTESVTTERRVPTDQVMAMLHRVTPCHAVMLHMTELIINNNNHDVIIDNMSKLEPQLSSPKLILHWSKGKAFIFTIYTIVHKCSNYLFSCT